MWSSCSGDGISNYWLFMILNPELKIVAWIYSASFEKDPLSQQETLFSGAGKISISIPHFWPCSIFVYISPINIVSLSLLLSYFLLSWKILLPGYLLFSSFLLSLSSSIVGSSPSSDSWRGMAKVENGKRDGLGKNNSSATKFAKTLLNSFKSVKWEFG